MINHELVCYISKHLLIFLMSSHSQAVSSITLLQLCVFYLALEPLLITTYLYLHALPVIQVSYEILLKNANNRLSLITVQFDKEIFVDLTS